MWNKKYLKLFQREKVTKSAETCDFLGLFKRFFESGVWKPFLKAGFERICGSLIWKSFVEECEKVNIVKKEVGMASFFSLEQKLTPTRNELLMAKHLFSHQYPLSFMGSLKNVSGAKPLLRLLCTPLILLASVRERLKERRQFVFLFLLCLRSNFFIMLW